MSRYLFKLLTYLLLQCFVMGKVFACPDQYTDTGSNDSCYPQYSPLTVFPAEEPWTDCTGWDNFFDGVVKSMTTYYPESGAVAMQVKCCGSTYPQVQTANLVVGQSHTFNNSNSTCDPAIVNYVFMDLINNAAYTNSTVSFKNVSTTIDVSTALNWVGTQTPQPISPVWIACNNVYALQAYEQPFFTVLCNAAGYSVASGPGTSTNLNLPTGDAVVCPAKVSPNGFSLNEGVDKKVICNIPIACAVFCATPDCGSEYTSPPKSSLVSVQCFFGGLGQMPPPFCCDVKNPAQTAVTYPICITDSNYGVGCVPPSPGSSTIDAPIPSSFFTPAIRVAFNSPGPNFMPVEPWSGEFIGANGITQANALTWQGGSPSNTATFCTSQVNNDCLLPPPALFNPQATNLEVIYTTASGEYTRSAVSLSKDKITTKPNSPYGVNLGNYCDLNYDLASNTALATSNCTMQDMYGHSQSFNVYITGDTLDTKQICVNNSAKALVGCAQVPSMPAPNVDLCHGIENKPSDFCMQLTFIAPDKTYTAQIQSTGKDDSYNPFSSTIFAGTIDGTNIPVYGFITDDNLNGTIAGKPLDKDENNNFCFDGAGKQTTNCSDTTNPGGLWYVNDSKNGLKYMGGGTQICYVGSSVTTGNTADNQASLCVPLSKITLPFVNCKQLQQDTQNACPNSAVVPLDSAVCAAYSDVKCLTPFDSDACFMKSFVCEVPSTDVESCNDYQNKCNTNASDLNKCYNDFQFCSSNVCAINFYLEQVNNNVSEKLLSEYRSCMARTYSSQTEYATYPPSCQYYTRTGCVTQSAEKDAYCGSFNYQCAPYQFYCTDENNDIICYDIALGYQCWYGGVYAGDTSCTVTGEMVMPNPGPNKATDPNLPICRSVFPENGPIGMQYPRCSATT